MTSPDSHASRVPTTSADGQGRRRRWRWILLGVLGALVILVALAPYIASMGPARGIVVGTLNDMLKGTFQLEGVSLSWFGPCKVRGLRVADPQGREVLSVGEAKLVPGLWGLFWSWENFQWVGVDRTKTTLHVDAQGNISLVEAFTMREPEPDKPLPEVYGTVNIKDASARVILHDGRTLEVTRITAKVAVDTLNTLSGDIEADLGVQGALKTTFTITELLRKGQMDPLHATVDLDVRTPEGRDIDLKSVLGLVTDQMTFGGKATFAANIKGTPLTPEGELGLTLRGFKAAPSGGGDVEAVDLKLAGKFAVTGGAAGVLDESLADKRTVSGEVTLTGDVGTVNATASWPHAAPPFTVTLTPEQWTSALLTGEVSMLPRFVFDMTADVDLARLARAAPALLNIRRDVKVTSGRLSIKDLSAHVGAAEAKPADSPSARGTVVLKDLQAQRDGKATPLPKLITLAFDVLLQPGKGLQVRDADLESEFVKVDTNGDVTHVEAAFRADLAGLYGQLSEVFDVGTFTVSGTTHGTVVASRDTDDVVRVVLKDVAARDIRYGKDARRLSLESADVTAGGELRLEAGALRSADVTLAELKAAGVHYTEDKHRLDLASVRASGKADLKFAASAAGSPVTALSPETVVVREGSVEIDGTTSVSGTGRWDPATGGFDATLEVPRADVASLVKKAAAFGTAPRELGRWGGSLQAKDVRVSRTAAGKPLTVTGPGTATLRNATLDGRTLDIENISVTWDRVELGPEMDRLSAGTLTINAEVASVSARDITAGWEPAASGTGHATVRADIARVLAILGRVTRSDAAPGMSGRLDWSGQFHSTPRDALGGMAVTVKSTGKVDNFAVRSGNAWERIGTVTFSQDADVTLMDDKLKRLTVRESRIDMPGKLVAVTTCTYVAAVGSLDASLDVQRADLAYLARLLYDEKGAPRPPFNVEAAAALGNYGRELRRYTGTLTIKADVKQASSKTPLTSTGTVSVAGAHLDGRPLSPRDVTFEWRNMKVGFETLDAEWLKADVGIAAASASAFSLTTGDEPRVKGKMHVLADIGGTIDLVKRAASAYPIARTLQTRLLPVTGRLNWTGDFTTTGAGTTFVGEGAIEHVQVGTPPGAYSDPKVTFSNKVDLDTQTKTLNVRELMLRATPIGVSIAGSVLEYDGRRILNLAGRYRGDWARVMPLVYQIAPQTKGNISLSGDASGGFTLKGTMNDPKFTPAWRGVDGGAQAGWTSARIEAISDVTFGKGTIAVTVKDGVIRIPVTEVSAGAGKVRMGAVVDGRTDPMMLYIPGKLQAIENFQFDKEFGRKFLSMINPIFGGSVQGLASVAVQDVTAPLDDPKTEVNETLAKMTGSGRLDLNNLVIESKGFLQALVGLIGLGGDEGYRVEHTGTDFVIRDGRVYYKDFVVPLRKNYDLIFSGSVGLADDRLDMLVSVPLTGNLLRKHGAGVRADDMARNLSIRVDFKITGTRDSPKFTPQFNPAKLIQKALRALLFDGIGGLLKPKK